MRARLLAGWDRIRTSFWFLPSIMVVASLVLAATTLSVDESLPDQWLGREWWWAYAGSAEGASVVLGTIAGSMITIAGVVFSLTLVALTLAASQFGPRLLRNFMRDTVNQAVIGTFVATFLYSLVVLLAIRRDEADPYVPHLSVSIAVVLALGSVGVLIYFIHHVAVSIQADEVVAQVASELMQGIERLFPEQIGEGQEETTRDDAAIPTFERDARPIASTTDGYLQLIDPDALLALATENDVVVRVERRPGHYVAAGGPLALVSPGHRVTDRFAERVNAAFIVGSRRTPAQDVEFGVEQLVEIALRALSPGVNEPFTAIRCVDRLGSALRRLARRSIPTPYRRDESGRVRVIAPLITFPDVMDAAFNQIRQSATTDVAVTVRLLETIAVIADAADRPEDREALRRHAGMAVRGARAARMDDEDLRAIEERYRAVCLLLDDVPGECS